MRKITKLFAFASVKAATRYLLRNRKAVQEAGRESGLPVEIVDNFLRSLPYIAGDDEVPTEQ